jgi:hypothetical protein
MLASLLWVSDCIQFGLGGLIQLAEIAWHQGVDLYSYNNSRLVNMMVRSSKTADNCKF